MDIIYDTLLHDYYKILKINLHTEEYEIISMINEDDKVPKTSISQWYFNYAHDYVHPIDVTEFIQFIDVYQNIKYFENNTSKRRCYYRRLMNGTYHWVCAEIQTLPGYCSENQLVLLTIREAGGAPHVERTLSLLRENIKSSEDFEKLIKEYCSNPPASVGFISLNTIDESIQDLIKMLFSGNAYKISNNDFFVVLEGITTEDFDNRLMELYTALREYDGYKIGTAWTDDEELGLGHLIQVSNEKKNRGLK